MKAPLSQTDYFLLNTASEVSATKSHEKYPNIDSRFHRGMLNNKIFGYFFMAKSINRFRTRGVGKVGLACQGKPNFIIFGKTRWLKLRPGQEEGRFKTVSRALYCREVRKAKNGG